MMFDPEVAMQNSKDIVAEAYEEYVEGVISEEQLDQILSLEMNSQRTLETLFGVWSFEEYA
jgi:hypothetical protein